MNALSLMNQVNSGINLQTGAVLDMHMLEAFIARFTHKSRAKLTPYYGLNRKPLGSVIMTDEEGYVCEVFALDVLICTRPTGNEFGSWSSCGSR